MTATGERLQREHELASQPLGDIPGEVLEDVFLPARGYMRARLIKAGDVIRFIDVEGQQVPDVLLYDPKNLKNVSSMSNTVMVAKSWKITTGHGIYAKLGQKMATIVADTVGMNVAIGGFCNPSVNEVRYGIEGTHSCRLNLVASMAEYNLSPADIEEGVFVPFMNMQFDPDGTCDIKPPLSKPGDHLDLRAEMDIIAAVSNCPSERNPCNGWNPSALRVVLYRPTT
jgi:uncharacterized protein